MSCGQPHDVDCQQALGCLYEYLDNEVGPVDHDRIAAHLDECAPCMQEYDVERVVKKIVARSCCSSAPAEFRTRLVAELNIRMTGWRPPGS